MRKIIALILVIALVALLALPVQAASPTFKMPKLPEIPDLSDDVKIELPGSFWDNYFRDHPFRLDFGRWFR